MALLIMLLIIIALEMLDAGTKRFLVREGGVIEQLSAAGYLICIILLLYQGKKRLENASFFLINLFLLFLGLREFDFHCRFTTMGIIKTRFYISAEVPFSEKLIGAAVVLLFLFTVFYLFKHHFRDFLTGLVNKESWAVGVFLGVALMVISKIADSQADFVELVLGRVGVDWNPMSVNVEEVMELNIPIMFLLAIFSRFQKSKWSQRRNFSISK